MGHNMTPLSMLYYRTYYTHRVPVGESSIALHHLACYTTENNVLTG